MIKDLSYFYREKNKEFKVLEAAYSYALVATKYKDDKLIMDQELEYLKKCCLELRIK